MDVDDVVKEIEQNIQWFCDKVHEPFPDDVNDREKVFHRMKVLGWIRQSEIETYNELTKKED